MLRIPLLLALLAFALPHCGGDEASDSAAPPPIEIRATVHPGQTITLSTQIEGRVETLPVSEGTTVAPGAEIALLSNPLIERDAALAQAELEWIELRLRGGGEARVSSGRPPESIEITARIVELRRQRLVRMRELRRTSDVTARDLEQSEIEYLGAVRDHDHERRVGLGQPVAIDAARLRIDREKGLAQLRFAEERMELLRVSTPIAGTITQIHATPGQIVFPREPIAEVSDISTLQVRGNVAPELLRYVRPGMPVEVKVFGVPTRSFADEIEYVIPAQGTGGQTRGATVVVTIPNPDGLLQPNTEAGITLRSPR